MIPPTCDKNTREYIEALTTSVAEAIFRSIRRNAPEGQPFSADHISNGMQIFEELRVQSSAARNALIEAVLRWKLAQWEHNPRHFSYTPPIRRTPKGSWLFGD